MIMFSILLLCGAAVAVFGGWLYDKSLMTIQSVAFGLPLGILGLILAIAGVLTVCYAFAYAAGLTHVWPL